MARTAALAAARRPHPKLDSTGGDLVEGRRNHKLVESEALRDPGADETCSHHKPPVIEMRTAGFANDPGSAVVKISSACAEGSQ
jgi:hypothetical protein